jgi:hypothetical protein
METAASDHPVDHELCMALAMPACDTTHLPRFSDPDLFARARYHGVHHLLLAKWGPDAKPLTLTPWRNAAIDDAIWELEHQQVLAQLAAALQCEGIAPLFIKGTALAYSIYADPVLRTRGDTDLLVPVGRKADACKVLETLGFVRRAAIPGEVVSHQATYQRETSPAHTHTVDLHWAFNNSPVLSSLFDYTGLMQNASAVPRLCSGVFIPDAVDSMLIACVHRLSHVNNPYWVDGHAHFGGDRLIWLVDIDLLAGSLDEASWSALLLRARERGLGPILLRALQETRSRLGTCIPTDIEHALREDTNAHEVDAYLSAGPLRQAWMDFRSLPAGARMRFMRETLLPDRAYIRGKYADARLRLLPLLYLRRIVEGAASRLTRRDSRAG